MKLSWVKVIRNFADEFIALKKQEFNEGQIKKKEDKKKLKL